MFQILVVGRKAAESEMLRPKSLSSETRMQRLINDPVMGWPYDIS
jgi:hypothetical protein